MKYHIYNMADNRRDTDHINYLKVIHNAGFFSCNTVAFMDIVAFINEHGKAPDIVDRSEQYINFKQSVGDNAIPYYFREYQDIVLPEKIYQPYDCMAIQFAPYNQIPFKEWLPVVHRYFMPSDAVGNASYNLVRRYNLDLDNLCAVFYRGNDKATEMSIAPYEAFIEKAKEVKKAKPNIRFFVLPDETEFWQAFVAEFPDAILTDATPHMPRQNSAVFYKHPKDKRAERGLQFFAALWIASRCETVITHSGNLGLWTCLYRGNANNVHQIHDGKWLM